MSRHRTTDPFCELLNPIRDPEKSFDINISELLQEYVRNFLAGSVNFNSAALLIQGSSSIYGKKVEYLHNLATKLHDSLVKNKKEDGAKKDTKEKEKHKKEKFTDPFCSTEIKMGKNLSCLRKKFVVKNTISKKAPKKNEKKFTFVPVDLLPIEENDKGMDIVDVNGTLIGKKAEFILNRCRVTSSGWLLLPNVSPDLIPNEFSSPDYSSDDLGFDNNFCNDSSPIDEGYPPSSGSTDSPSSVPSSQDPSSVPSSQDPSSIPSSQGTDEGLGSLPCTPQEGGSQPEGASNDNTPGAKVSPTETPMEGVQETHDGIEGIENIPLDDASVAPKSRRSSRNPLKLCQIQEDGAPKQPEENAPTVQEKEAVAIKKAIQKKNTCNLPSKLKASDTIALYPASEFCARTFFSMDRKYSNNLNHSGLEVPAFQNHNGLFQKFLELQVRLLKLKTKDKPNAPAVEENDGDEEIDADGVEEILDDPGTNDDIVTTPLEAADIVIENNPALAVPASDNENPLAEAEPMSVEDLDNGVTAYNEKELEVSFQIAAQEQCNLFRRDLQKYVQTSDISERVHGWEVKMKPFLERLKKREEFDIDLYGSRILNSFGDNNRKQTITFRNFCKGKEKWEIHRYFMALLPLVNIGNVSIEATQLNDGGEDILLSLLSRKMHHKELEEFGHNEGEH